MNALDIETFTKDDKIIPYCVVCTFNDKETMSTYGLNSLEEMLKKILNKNFSKKIIYVHNLNYDGFLILEELSKGLWEFEIFSKKLNLYLIKIFFNGKYLLFKCSYKILPLSLKEIAQGFLIGEKMPYPYRLINSNNIYLQKVSITSKDFESCVDYFIYFKQYGEFINIPEYTLQYCLNDVTITINFLKKIKKMIKIFDIRLENVASASSLAFKIFIKHFNKNKVSFNNEDFVNNYTKKAYFGGRCEVYGNAEKSEKIFHFDFSGMYASCMKEKFPFGDSQFIENCEKIEKPGFYWIEYESENMCIPILPHHRLNDKKLMFTNGRNKGVFWYEEILLFIKYGGIVLKILHALVYKEWDYIFTEYVNFFSEMRKKDSVSNIFAKLMINSIYGRLGMSSPDTYSFIDKKKNINYWLSHIDVLNIKELNEIVLLESEINEKLKKYKNLKFEIKNNIAIAAIITSKARIKLYNAQQDVIRQGGRLLYSDTDSIFAAFKTDVIGQQHGEVFWNPENDKTCVAEGIFFASKSYAIKYKNGFSEIKIKGYNDTTLTFDDLKKQYVSGDDLILKKFKFLSKKKLYLRLSTNEKKINLNFYDKRYFINHFETRPFYYHNYTYLK